MRKTNTREEVESMFSLALRYARYTVASLATVAFGLATN
jgi:hypothetical protein